MFFNHAKIQIFRKNIAAQIHEIFLEDLSTTCRKNILSEVIKEVD